MRQVALAAMAPLSEMAMSNSTFLVVANASLIRDCSAVDKDIFVRDTAGDDPKPLFVLNHLRVPTSCRASTIIVVVAFL